MTATEDFVKQADGYRRELLAHCYRMIGSVQDAEDAVQDTYLRAWSSFDRFEGRSSLRTWLYKIATNTCLTALERNSRRPLPSMLAPPSDEISPPLSAPKLETPWLQPLPDALVAPDPASVVVSRDSVRLAFVAALQHLPARQRAVLILRDVLAWPAAEVADLLDTTTASVTSALQRARAQLAEVMPAEDETVEPSDVERRALLTRYVTALQDGDMAGLVALLRADVELEMPPIPTWFAGRANVSGFLKVRCLDTPSTWRYRETAANGQAAVALYRNDDDGAYLAHNVQVLTLVGGQIARIVAFRNPALFDLFDLPAEA